MKEAVSLKEKRERQKRDERNHSLRMLRMQEAKLHNHTEQKGSEGENRTEEIL
jgi:hypothetical protein